MQYLENQIYHVYNQGNNKQDIFFEEENYLFFLGKMRKHILPNADILCYCLMPNHFHWLLIPNKAGVSDGTAIKLQNKVEFRQSKIEGTFEVPSISTKGSPQQVLSHQIGTLLSGYTKAINKRYIRSGSLFRGKTKVKDGWIDGFITLKGKDRNLFFRADNDYALQCFHYIHNNPVNSGLVVDAVDWKFSSARDYAGLRKGTMVNFQLANEIFF